LERNRWWFLNFSTASLIFNKYKHEMIHRREKFPFYIKIR
jgi:hypothetical protein